MMEFVRALQAVSNRTFQQDFEVVRTIGVVSCCWSCEMQRALSLAIVLVVVVVLELTWLCCFVLLPRH